MASTASHYVSVLMCSGPTTGKVFVLRVADLTHRRKKLDIGAHVLVKQPDGRRRRRGVIVNMNPRVYVALPSRPDIISRAAPVRAEPGLVQYNRHGAANVLILRPPQPDQRQLQAPSQPVAAPAQATSSSRFPGRHRVRRELDFSGPRQGPRSIKAPYTADELAGIVPLDLLSSYGEARAAVRPVSTPRAREEAALPPSPLARISLHPPMISPLRNDNGPSRPLPFASRLLAQDQRPADVDRQRRVGAEMVPSTCGVFPDLITASSRVH